MKYAVLETTQAAHASRQASWTRRGIRVDKKTKQG